jgi:GNAT superfamily N-acetyltransferase
MNKVVDFINDKTVKLWRGQKEFGDDSLEDSDHLLIQRSMGPGGKGIMINKIGVKKDSRRKGRASKMLTIIEKTTREAGLKFVELQTVESEEMLKLIQKRKGYSRSNEWENEMPWDYPGNYIIKF